MTPLEEGSWKLTAGFLLTLPHMPFLFADFALYLFAIVNYSSEYDYMLSPVSPSESWIWGVVLESPESVQRGILKNVILDMFRFPYSYPY